MKHLRTSALCLVLLLLQPSVGESGWRDSFDEWFQENMIDAEDGKIDMSEYLASARGFFPVPIIITEPAVGYGIGAAVAYFHAPKSIDEARHPHKGPPSISVGFAAATENDTKLFGGAHLGVWNDDHVRYMGAIAGADVNLKFYPNVGAPDASDEGIRFNVDGEFLYQQLQFRLMESDWWLGGSYLYINAKNTFDLGDGAEEPPGSLSQFEQGGLGFFVQYDGRDTVFTPTQGLNGRIEYRNYDRSWGSDFDYDHVGVSLHHHTPFGEYSSLGLRLDAESVDGDVPFFGYPFVNLRGIPAMRYQGEIVVNAEAEFLWGFTPRWTIALFAGAARASSVDLFETSREDVAAGGVGFRYRIARKLGMQVGMDVARGPEDT
jgi:hypothetical protein